MYSDESILNMPRMMKVKRMTIKPVSEDFQGSGVRQYDGSRNLNHLARVLLFPGSVLRSGAGFGMRCCIVLFI